MKVAVIGGGASGLAAAITAREGGHDVTLFERQARVGRKLMATGNGRCNLTNLGASVDNYHGADAAFVAPALSEFTVSDTLAWFSRLGLVSEPDPEGRVYPFSDQAGSVLDVLRFRCDAIGVRTETGTEIEEIRRKNGCFAVNGEQYDRIIIACGGRAGEHLGGTGLGYDLLRSLGHRITPLTPGLVRLKTAEEITRMLKGVRAKACVRLLRRGRLVCEKSGEVQFSDGGVSGIVVMDMSSLARDGDALSLDLLPPVNAEKLQKILAARASSTPSESAENLLAGVLHSRLGKAVIKRCGLDFGAKLAGLGEKDIEKVAKTVKDFALTITGRAGFPEAQVTCGGADTAEFKPFSLESRLVPGLYACGEVLDVDGDCGGYNLQWAWSSGRLAGCLR